MLGMFITMIMAVEVTAGRGLTLIMTATVEMVIAVLASVQVITGAALVMLYR